MNSDSLCFGFEIDESQFQKRRAVPRSNNTF